MPDAVFPYPGGKSKLASWILEHLPEHTCYVEVFGGAANVLVNKDQDRSEVEVYNDRDGDLVHFFETLRDQPDELIEWLDDVPLSRELHQRWVDLYYNGYRPSDPIERAGQFFFLRYAQFGAGYSGPNGFATGKTKNQAKGYANKIDRLQKFADRFDRVVIENLDWKDVINKYDGPETVFYCDPPYVDQEAAYPVNDIDHAEFVDVLDETEGNWLVSYEDIPDGLEEYEVIERGHARGINSGKSGSAKRVKERLIVNTDE